VVAGVVAAVVLAGGGGDENKVLTSGEIVKANKHATISIDTRGPGFDENNNEVVVSGGGSGIVIDARKRYALTNAHVVAGATSVKAHLENGESVNARVLGTAPCEDLAVLELATKPRGLKAATLGRSAAVSAGDHVTALGFPGAFEADITQRRLQSNEGTISSKPGPATLGNSLPSLPAVIQHQAPINAGNSGGPLFNDHGEVIGVNTFAAVSSGAQNQNGAIAIDRARSLLPALRRGQDRGYVGWSLQNVASLNNDLYVTAVDANSPADRAHFLFADRIDKIDNTTVQNVPDVCDILGSKTAGDRLKIEGQEADGTFFTTTLRLR
jgi:S1-C subfamily serine protease